MSDNTPPGWSEWVREIPFDSAEWLGIEERGVLSDSEADRAKEYKQEQALARQGIKLMTPTFPELFEHLRPGSGTSA